MSQAARREPMSGPLLVGYATANGQTSRIAKRLAERLRERGFEVDLLDLAALPDDLSLDRYRGVLLGAPVHGGHHLAAAVEFAARHQVALGSLPSGFFSVSLTAADDDDHSRAATRAYLDSFVRETGWHPAHDASLAGALLLSHYGVFERALMRLIARRRGHKDVRGDQEYTDWAAVDHLADELASAIDHPADG